MFAMILRRLLLMVPTLLIISVISFIIIQLPPGDYLTSYVAALEASGESIEEAEVAALREKYSLDEPFHIQYWLWMKGLLHGDMGISFEWNRKVTSLIGERLFLTVILSVSTMLFVWAIAIPIGIFSAVKQYSLFDYIFTFFGFIGLSIPSFLLALVLMYIGYKVFGVSAGGLFSAQYQNAEWSLAKFGDFLAHLWIPVVIVGLAGTAGMIRVMRGNLLDELPKQYVMTARAKGVSRVKLLLKYPVRVALNPVVSSVAWMLPDIISGTVIVAVVLGLPTVGPLLLQSLLNQDMYLAGSLIMMLSFFTVIGTLISDILLAWLDPRIRFNKRER